MQFPAIQIAIKGQSEQSETDLFHVDKRINVLFRIRHVRHNNNKVKYSFHPSISSVLLTMMKVLAGPPNQHIKL
jgi:hypothetical protein